MKDTHQLWFWSATFFLDILTRISIRISFWSFIWKGYILCIRCIYYIDSPKGCKFFWKVLFFCTHYTLSLPPYRPMSTGSGSILGFGHLTWNQHWGHSYIRGSHALYPYLTSVSCFTGETSVSGIEPETCSQSFGHRAKALSLSFLCIKDTQSILCWYANFFLRIRLLIRISILF